MLEIKGSTEHLTFFLTKDEKGKAYYQVWEKGDTCGKPIAMYDGDKILHLRDDFPVPEKNYKYFDEMCDVISNIYEAKKRGEF